jgi:8-oxo-dGTP pyrophosphatase MutT (NUDIX family)
MWAMQLAVAFNGCVRSITKFSRLGRLVLRRLDAKWHKQFVAKQLTARSSQQSRISSKTGSRTRAPKTQYAALPYRLTKARGIEFLLVTSRETGRWIIPKGWPIGGLKPAKAAAREAYEEAGVRGIVSTRAIGEYAYTKEYRALGRTLPCKVMVFALLVRRQRRTWPEAHQRRSRWVRPRRAASLITEDGLRSLIAKFARHVIVGHAWARSKDMVRS